MYSKQFADRLNQELDKIDFPTHLEERIEAFAKLMHITRFKAQTTLNGHIPPESALIDNIVEELEVDRKWLLGDV